MRQGDVELYLVRAKIEEDDVVELYDGARSPDQAILSKSWTYQIINLLKGSHQDQRPSENAKLTTVVTIRAYRVVQQQMQELYETPYQLERRAAISNGPIKAGYDSSVSPEYSEGSPVVACRQMQPNARNVFRRRLESLLTEGKCSIPGATCRIEI